VRDLAAFTACLDASDSAAAVDAEYASGEKAGVNSTPNLLINGELVRGVYPYEVLKAKIDKALDGQQSAHR
jgi:protein-disulfide isomerase